MSRADPSLFRLLKGASKWDDELLFKTKRRLDRRCSDMELWDLNFRCGIPWPTETVLAYGLRGKDRRQALLVFVELVTPKELAHIYYSHMSSDYWRQRSFDPEWVECFFTETKPQRVRLWATLHDIEVSPRGRLPSRIVQAFEQDLANKNGLQLSNGAGGGRPPLQ